MNNQTYALMLMEDGLPIEERLSVVCLETGAGATKILRDHLNEAWFSAIPVDERALLESINEYAEREIMRLLNIESLREYNVRVSIEGYPNGAGAPNVKVSAKKIDPRSWSLGRRGGYVAEAVMRTMERMEENGDDRLPFTLNTRYGEPRFTEGEGRYRVVERMAPMNFDVDRVARFGL